MYKILNKTIMKYLKKLERIFNNWMSSHPNVKCTGRYYLGYSTGTFTKVEIAKNHGINRSCINSILRRNGYGKQ